MKKYYSLMFVCIFIAAIAVQAQPLKMQGVVFSENNGKYWRVGKVTADGVKVVKAIIPAEAADQISPYDGQDVVVSGEKDASWTGSVPKFAPGFTVEVVK